MCTSFLIIPKACIEYCINFLSVTACSEHFYLFVKMKETMNKMPWALFRTHPIVLDGKIWKMVKNLPENYSESYQITK